MGFEFSAKKSAIVTATGTLALNLVLNGAGALAEFSRAVGPGLGNDEPSAGKKSDNNSVRIDAKEGDTNYDPKITWEGDKSLWLATTFSVGATTNQVNHIDVSQTQAMRFAKKFSDDPNARVPINQADIEELRENLGAKLDEELAGKTVMYTPFSRLIENALGGETPPGSEPVTLKSRLISGTSTGSASFEGNAGKGDSSVAENSIDPENIKLAQVRGEVARQVVLDLLAERGFEREAMSQAVKVTAEENQPTAEQYQKLTDWAEKNGMEGDTPQAKLRNAINGFNAGTLTGLSSEDQNLFKQSLDNHRYGKVTILLEQQLKGQHIFSIIVLPLPWITWGRKEEQEPAPEEITGPPPPPDPTTIAEPNPIIGPTELLGPKLLGIGDGPPKLIGEGLGGILPEQIPERFLRKVQQQRDLVDIDLLEYFDRHPVVNYRALIETYHERVNVNKTSTPLEGMNQLTHEIISAWNIADRTNHFENEVQRNWAADHAARLIELLSAAKTQNKDIHAVLREDASAGLASFVDNKLGRNDLDLYDSALASIKHSFVEYYDLIRGFQALSKIHGDEVAVFKTAAAVLSQWEKTDGQDYFGEVRQVRAASAHADVIRSVVEAARVTGSDDYLGILRRLG